jgi:phosphopantetheine--protein transferase-like protein
VIGVDVVSIKRIVAANKNDRLIQEILSNKEIEYLNSKSKEIKNGNLCSAYNSTLAGFWAAKEAVLKALEIGIKNGIALKDVQILHKGNGAPMVQITSKNSKIEAMLAGKTIFISISHDAEIAIAVCQIA